MRLIDADKYKQTLEYWIADIESTYDKEANAECRATLDCICQLDDAPTIDAVPVVRCKDCKHWNRDRANIHRGDCLEIVPEVWMNENDFCSYGLKKDEWDLETHIESGGKM